MENNKLSVWNILHTHIFSISQVDKDFHFGLFELDWDVFGSHIENACQRIPAVEETGIRSTVCGPGMEIFQLHVLVHLIGWIGLLICWS